MPLLIVDARELSKRLGIGYGTVLDWHRNGKIPGMRTSRGKILFNLDAVLDSLSRDSSGVAEGSYPVVAAQ